MAHTCHAFGCTRECPPEYLMHPGHWRMVPRDLQREVLRTYRVGQCNWSSSGIMPSPEWHIAADLAIAAVARAEGKLKGEKYHLDSAEFWRNVIKRRDAAPEPEVDPFRLGELP